MLVAEPHDEIVATHYSTKQFNIATCKWIEPPVTPAFVDGRFCHAIETIIGFRRIVHYREGLKIPMVGS